MTDTRGENVVIPYEPVGGGREGQALPPRKTLNWVSPLEALNELVASTV